MPLITGGKSMDPGLRRDDGAGELALHFQMRLPCLGVFRLLLPFYISCYYYNKKLELWLSLFRAKTEEELAKLEEMGVPEMTEAINIYREITVTPEFREAARLRERARHDEAQALYNAENKGLQKGLQEGLHKGRQESILDVARTALAENVPHGLIVKLTGLSLEAIERLAAELKH